MEVADLISSNTVSGGATGTVGDGTTESTIGS